MTTWEEWTPSTRSKRWKRRKRKKNDVAQAWMRTLGVLLVVVGLGSLAWEIQQQIDERRAQHTSTGTAALEVIQGTIFSPWQQEILDSLEQATSDVGSGKVIEAEVNVDRAGSLLTGARLQSRFAEPDFYKQTISALDAIWDQRPGDDRLFEHVAQARVELATLRSAQNGADADAKSKNAGAASTSGSSLSTVPTTDAAGLAAAGDDSVIPAVHSGNASAQPAAAIARSATPPANTTLAGSPAKPLAPDGKISIAASRTMAAGFTLNPTTLGKDYLDATLLPESAEILLPPANRLITDNIRVEDLTIEGAAQTLDGIQWRNVTFVNTRLRYEKGAVDLENVHFIHCTFGFPPDLRGSRLATAIALGQSSVSVE